MELKDFKVQVTKANVRKKGKVRNSLGVYDIYKTIRRNKWFDIGRPLTEHEFYTIIGRINDYLAEELKLGKTIVFPQRMGKLELLRSKRGVFLKDGKLKVTYPINWDKTLELWYTDEEARRNKTLIRIETDCVFRVLYNRHNANYNNKTFYKFKLNRFIQRALKVNIDKGLIDTLYG